VGTIVQDRPQINPVSQPRWDRFERADLFEQYRQLRTQGISERQAAKDAFVRTRCRCIALRSLGRRLATGGMHAHRRRRSMECASLGLGRAIAEVDGERVCMPAGSRRVGANPCIFPELPVWDNVSVTSLNRLYNPLF
jgi:hypothetical protein